MKKRKVFLWLGAGILAAVLLVGALFLIGAQRDAARLDAVKRAAAARELLLDHFGLDVFSEGVQDGVPEYLIGRYIDEDLKLRIRLQESARDQEAAIRESLGEYADVAVFDYLSVTAQDLRLRAADMEALLKQQGYANVRAAVCQRTGNFYIFFIDEIENINKVFPEVDAWVREQKEYPFDDVGVSCAVVGYSVDYVEAPYVLGSEQAMDALAEWLKAEGEYEITKTSYGGKYVGWDGKLHVVMKEGITQEQRKGLEASLKDYSDITVYEYGGYSREEVREYLDELVKSMREMGIPPTLYGFHEKIGLPNMEVLREDLHLLQILLESEEAPTINGNKVPLILAPGGIARAA